MSYEIYRKIVSLEEYFSRWDEDKLKSLDEDHSISGNGREYVYSRYVVKAEVLQRAGFKCQNTTCKTPEDSLTWHHIKFQKNNGKDSTRNSVCLCKSCHDGYHQAKLELLFPNNKTVPSHVSGHRFKLDKPDKPSYAYFSKEFIKSQKAKRKELKHLCGIKITLDEWLELMKFLEFQYD
jgi:hypothetical protein